jgi:hypothetical protein
VERTENIEITESSTDSAFHLDASQIIEKIMHFLRLLMCETLVKRILSLVLIAADVPNARVTELTGLCGRRSAL